MPKFKNNIVKIRKEKGISQKQLSKIMGIQEPMLCEIEKGRKDPRISTVKRISAALSVTVDNLIA